MSIEEKSPERLANEIELLSRDTAGRLHFVWADGLLKRADLPEVQRLREAVVSMDKGLSALNEGRDAPHEHADWATRIRDELARRLAEFGG